ncbi:hypothetical protein [Salinarimonas ramus]|uniref:hypothetical protein n=1 Tax=Salinarimonas ramus TaxID=690164 RepID=UPI001662A005|nr:hypothetical protein [Salinarimonas ramus]
MRPPKPKMVACVEPTLGLFYRINTKRWPPAVKLVRDPLHPFLDHDSYLECGDPLELDDYIVDASLRRNGVVGEVHRSLSNEIVGLLALATTLREGDRRKIIEALS